MKWIDRVHKLRPAGAAWRRMICRECGRRPQTTVSKCPSCAAGRPGDAAARDTTARRRRAFRTIRQFRSRKLSRSNCERLYLGAGDQRTARTKRWTPRVAALPRRGLVRAGRDQSRAGYRRRRKAGTEESEPKSETPMPAVQPRLWRARGGRGREQCAPPAARRVARRAAAR